MNKILIGTRVRHKTILDQTMIVIDSKDYEYQCRYYNIITGLFVTEWFIEEELEIIND